MKRKKNPWLVDADVGATQQTYEIRTVFDFLNVPEERRRICLREFDAWLSLLESVPALLVAVSDSMGAGLTRDHIQRRTEAFVWVDDGKATISVTLDCPDEAQDVEVSTD